jgi:hypothetical protein
MNAGYIKQNFYFRSDYLPGSDYYKFMRQHTGYVKLGKNKHDDANDMVTGLAEYVKLLTFTKAKQKVRKRREDSFDFDEEDAGELSDTYINMGR